MGIRYAILLLVAFAGCGRSTESPPPKEAKTAVRAEFRLHIPPPDSMPSAPSRRGGAALESVCPVGRRADLGYFDGLDTVAVPVPPSDSARGMKQAVPFARWFAVRTEVLGASPRDTVHVVTEKLESLNPHATWPRTDAVCLFIRLGRVVQVLKADPRSWPDSNLTAECERRVDVIPIENGRGLLIVRTEYAPGAPGGERYEAFGITPSGAWKELSGAFGYVKDGDLPPSLKNGQVFYAGIAHGCVHFRVPITLDLDRWQFVAELGDDAVFSAVGEGRPQLEGSRTLTMPIYLYPRYSSRSRTIEIREDSRIDAHRFYAPWFVYRRGDRRYSSQDWLQVRVDSLLGWIPDSLYRFVGFSQCE